MTDDHNPIELSWELREPKSKPVVRFSIECVGLLAGTSEDPENERISITFKPSDPQADVWFNHFDSFFGLRTIESPDPDHQSKIFWAFDLGEDDITSKAYFFPGRRIVAATSTNLEAITEAITTAPGYGSQQLHGLSLFIEFQQKQQAFRSTEIEMLAIDLLEPRESRLKIYFRDRRTSFAALRQTMTLDGQIMSIQLESGLAQLKKLWCLLFCQSADVSDDTELPPNEHRTAGLLYNIEFRPGRILPTVKVYLPVRHYSLSDQQILMALEKFQNCNAGAEISVQDPTPNLSNTISSPYYRAISQSL